MNKFFKNLSAIVLAMTVFTVNIPMESVYALDLIKFEDGAGGDDEGTDDEAGADGDDAGTDGDDEGTGDESGTDDDDADDKDDEVPEGQKVERTDLSFEINADDTGTSKTVFSDDDSYNITVANKSGNSTIKYEWFVNDESKGESPAGDTYNPSNLAAGDYEIYVEGTYIYIDADNKEQTDTVVSSKVTLTVITRHDPGETIDSAVKVYNSGYSGSLSTVYLKLGTSEDYNDYEVKWVAAGALAGGTTSTETDNNYFNYQPPASLIETAGEYEIYAEIYYDHDGSGSATAFLQNSDPITITVQGDDVEGVTISGETKFSDSATGYSSLNAVTSGIPLANITGYMWTLDGEEITGETKDSLSMNLTGLKASQKYAVIVSYTYLESDGSTATNTVTASVTVTKGDSSGGDSDSDSDGGSGDNDSSGGQTGDGSVYPQLLTDLSTASKVYVQNREASPLTVSVDPRIDGTISYKWYVNTVYSTVGGTLLNYEYGISGNTSSITPSVTPSTATVGTYYYYVEVTNHYDDYTKTTRSNIATIQVISDDTAPTKYTVGADGVLEVADYSKVVIDWSTFDEFIDNGGEVLTITGAYIQNLRVPAVYSNNSYEVVVNDTGYELDYSWKIKDGSKVSGYLDLALSTTTSLSGVEKGDSALNYDARYSQVIQFKHEGALTTNDKGITLTMPTTVKDGDAHLNKINTDATVNYNTYVKGSIENGLLTVNMKECSDWVVSALKLAALTDYDNTNGTGALTGFLNIPTFVGFEVSEFKNVVVGQMLYLDKINMDTIENNRFAGWYYDTAFLEPVSANDVKSGMLVTREIVTNGLYPKYDKTNSYVPTVSTAVPSTGVVCNNTVIKLEALF